MATNVSLQATGFAETLVAVLAPDLAADAVGTQVVTERVPIGVLLVTYVTLEILAFVTGCVNTSGGAVVEFGWTPVADELALDRGVQVIGVGGLIKVGRDGVSGNVKAEVATQVLTVGEALEAGQADEALGLVVVQLLLGQGQPVPPGHVAEVVVGVSVVLGQLVESLFPLLSSSFLSVFLVCLVRVAGLGVTQETVALFFGQAGLD